MFAIKVIQRPKREGGTSLAEHGPETQPWASSSQRVMCQKKKKKRHQSSLFNMEVPKTSPKESTSEGWNSGKQGGQGSNFRSLSWCPSRRHPHLHRPLSLAPGRGPAAGRLPRLHPRGAHQQRAAGLQGPPAAGPGRLAGLQVLQRVQARPVPCRGEGQRGVRVPPRLDRPAVRPGGPRPLPRPQVGVPPPLPRPGSGH